MAAATLLELVERLLTDSDAAASFRAAPDQFLDDHGLGDLSGGDVIDALSLGFESVAPDLAVRLVLPADSATFDDASAADALADLLDAAPAESVLDDADDAANDAGVDLDLDFGRGDVVDHGGFGAGGSDIGDARAADLDLDLGADGGGLAAVDDLDTATFDQGFGSGSDSDDVDHLYDVDDLDFGGDHNLDDVDGPDGVL